MLDIIYGIEALPENDPYIAIAERAVASLTSAAIPGAFLVDTFPLLKHIPEWIPGAGFQKKAKAWKKVHKDLVHEPYKASKQAIVSYNFNLTRRESLFMKYTGTGYGQTMLLLTAPPKCP